MPIYAVNYNGLHKRPDYSQLLDYLQNNQDMIRYPDRFAKQMRNHPYLTQFDSESFGLTDAQIKAIQKQDVIKANMVNAASALGGPSITDLRAMQPPKPFPNSSAGVTPGPKAAVGSGATPAHYAVADDSSYRLTGPAVSAYGSRQGVPRFDHLGDVDVIFQNADVGEGEGEGNQIFAPRFYSDYGLPVPLTRAEQMMGGPVPVSSAVLPPPPDQFDIFTASPSAPFLSAVGSASPPAQFDLFDISSASPPAPNPPAGPIDKAPNITLEKFPNPDYVGKTPSITLEKFPNPAYVGKDVQQLALILINEPVLRPLSEYQMQAELRGLTKGNSRAKVLFKILEFDSDYPNYRPDRETLLQIGNDYNIIRQYRSAASSSKAKVT